MLIEAQTSWGSNRRVTSAVDPPKHTLDPERSDSYALDSSGDDMTIQRSFAFNTPADGDAWEPRLPSELKLLVEFKPVHVARSTFKAGVAASVHRWFRLTPSFGPDLVRLMLDKLNCSSSDVVLDPFAGASTTLIECKLNGIRSFGFEINPFLHFVGRVSTDWSIESEILREELSKIQDRFASSPLVSNIDDLQDIGLAVPPIHNPHRWWRSDVLIDLLRLKRCIRSSADDRVRDFFLLAFAGALVPDLTNVTLGRLQLHFVDKSNASMDVMSTFVAHASGMIDDLADISSMDDVAVSKIYLQDSLNLSELKDAPRASAVITSPPYPNRYSYVWNTRPHLYMLDFFDTAKQASALDRKTIGGTWGTATSELAKGCVEPRSTNVAGALKHIIKPLRDADVLMSNYVVHYFNRLEQQIIEMDRALCPTADLAYVVGNSEIKGIYVDTDVILASLIEGCGLGFRVTDVSRFRRRNSGRDLFETIVFARRRG